MEEHPDKINHEVLMQRIVELEMEIKTLEKNLIHDGLTGLKTRAFFEEETTLYLELITQVQSSKRRQWFGFKNLSVLFFDIDHFKSINDTYGHEAGDTVLQTVAKTIAQSFRHGDTVARWGGEEIVASLLGADEEDAKQKAESVLENIRGIIFPEFPDLHITVSIGVAAAYPKVTFKDLIKNADEAMYSAKQGGRNRVIAYSGVQEQQK